VIYTTSVATVSPRPSLVSRPFSQCWWGLWGRDYPRPCSGYCL